MDRYGQRCKRDADVSHLFHHTLSGAIGSWSKPRIGNPPDVEDVGYALDQVGYEEGEEVVVDRGAEEIPRGTCRGLPLEARTVPNAIHLVPKCRRLSKETRRGRTSDGFGQTCTHSDIGKQGGDCDEGEEGRLRPEPVRLSPMLFL